MTFEAALEFQPRSIALLVPILDGNEFYLDFLSGTNEDQEAQLGDLQALLATDVIRPQI